MKKLLFPFLVLAQAFPVQAQTVLLDGADAASWLTAANRAVTTANLSRTGLLSPVGTRIPAGITDTLQKYDWVQAGDYYYKDNTYSDDFLKSKIQYAVLRIDDGGNETHLTGGSTAEGEPPFLIRRDEIAPYPVNVSDYGGYTFKCDERGVCSRIVSYAAGILLVDKMEDENADDFGKPERFRIVYVAVPRMGGSNSYVSIPAPPRPGKAATITAPAVKQPQPATKPPAAATPPAVKPVTVSPTVAGETEAQRLNKLVSTGATPPFPKVSLPALPGSKAGMVDDPEDDYPNLIVADGPPVEKLKRYIDEKIQTIHVTQQELLNPVHTKLPLNMVDTLTKYDWVAVGDYFYNSGTLGSDYLKPEPWYFMTRYEAGWEYRFRVGGIFDKDPAYITFSDGNNPWPFYIKEVNGITFSADPSSDAVGRISSYHNGVMFMDVCDHCTVTNYNTKSRFRHIYIAVPKLQLYEVPPPIYPKAYIWQVDPTKHPHYNKK